jgi:serine/threonine-protein kinase
MQSVNVENDRLDEVLAAYLREVKEGNHSSGRRILSAHPDLAEEITAFLEDWDQFDRLAAPIRLVVPPRMPDESQTRIGHYDLLEVLGHGGMGVIYRARDRKLNRIVALKMLRVGASASEGELLRFRAEAEAVADLDHPHIVPIFDVGEHKGQPFFSMRLMEGGSLASRINDFALGWPGLRCSEAPVRSTSTPATHKPTPAQIKSQQSKIVNLLVIVARAVHFAHEHGILHRDLKPANIMLDGEDRPYVSDFGLAKRVEGSERTVHEDSLTVTGAVVGTPSYMAPEQALGQKGVVTTAADVYSLGAILYELLTGQPPFQESTPLATLRQITEQEPVSPRAVSPSVDRDLETICLKCLDKDPARRYPSAAALAEDLQRFQGGEPIQARPLGRFERLTRWCRRQPVLAGLAAALVLSLVVGLGLVTWQWQRAEEYGQNAEAKRQLAEQFAEEAQHQEKEAKRHETQAIANAAEANRQKDLAEEGFLQAHRAVNDFVVRFSERVAQVPGLQSLRKELLDAALGYFQSFIKQRGHDPKLQDELAQTYVSVGRITGLIGSKVEARKAFVEARTIFEKLHHDTPTDLKIHARLASTCNSLGIKQHETGQTQDALTSLNEARSLYLECLQARPDDRQFQADLAGAWGNIGILYSEMGELTKAVAAYEEARTLQEKLVKRYPENLSFQLALAATFSNLGLVEGQQNKQETTSLQSSQDALALRKRLAAKEPRNTSYQSALADSYHNLGFAQERLGKMEDAWSSWHEAFAIRKKLVDESPNVTAYKSALASSFTQLGIEQAKKKNDQEALKNYQEARKILQVLVANNPETLAFRRDLAKSYFNIGVHLARLGLKPEALAVYEQARDHQEKLVQADPGATDLHNDLSATLNNLGILHGQLNHFDLALTALTASVEQGRIAFDKVPTNSHYRHGLGSSYGSMGELLRALNRPADAVNVTLERRKLWVGNANELYLVARDLCRAARLVGKGKKELSNEETAERLRITNLAMDILRECVACGFKDLDRLQKDTETDLALIQQQDDFKELVKTLQEKKKAASH